MLGDYYDDLWRHIPDGDPPDALADWVDQLPPARRALDLGCGDGRLTARLRASDVTAADVSLVALKRVRARLPDATAIVLGADRALPFADASFDLVLCADVLDHVLDLRRTVAEARRVLAPDGRLAVATPELGLRAAVAIAFGRGDPRFDPLGPPRRHFTRVSLRDVLELAGLHVTTLDARAGHLLALAEP